MYEFLHLRNFFNCFNLNIQYLNVLSGACFGSKYKKKFQDYNLKKKKRKTFVMIFFLLETTAKSPTSQSWKPWRGSGKRNYRNFILTLLGSFPKVCISIHYTDTYQFTLQ